MENELNEKSAIEPELTESEKLEQTKLDLDKREKELNERELKAEYKDRIKASFNDLNLALNDDLSKEIEARIDYTNKDTFTDSYNEVLNFIEAISKAKIRRSSYNPVAGNAVTISAIDRAFKPPKTY